NCTKMKWREKRMYDKVFPPAKITLPNGKVVYEKKSRAPIILILLVLATIISVRFTNFNLNTLFKRGHEFFVIIGQMIPPKWDYLSNIWKPLLDTIKMSLLGSILGSIAAVPVAYFASSNIVSKPVATVAKFFLSILR